MKKFLGIYIHIPFCSSKCGYCDFYSFRASHSDFEIYIEAIKKSIIMWGEKCKSYKIDTVYFGGGTPSIIGGDMLSQILCCIYKNFDVDKNAEITVECNPESTNEKLLFELSQIGVNRLSFGVQSMNDEILKIIQRKHTKKQVKDAILNARKYGFNNLSVDIIYGLPSQTIDILKNDIEQILELEPKHFSCYALKLEENTSLFNKKILLPDDDIVADMYDKICELLSKYDYEHYEISNWSKKGFKSKHNLKYWNFSEYLGIGCSAHSFFKNNRFSYKDDIKSFLTGELPQLEQQVNDFDRENEFIFLSLRTNKGINKYEYEKNFGLDFNDIVKAVKKFEKYGYCYIGKDYIRLTEKGFFISNTIFCELLK